MNKTSVIKRYGGKFRLLKYILPFPEHETYVDVFGGSAVVLINKTPSKYEIFNDINDRLLKFWNILKNQREEFENYCRDQGDLLHRSIFTRCLTKSHNGLEEAFRFFYTNTYSFSGKGTEFKGFDDHSSFQNEFENKIQRFRIIQERIRNVHFENQDFRDLLKQFSGLEQHSNLECRGRNFKYRIKGGFKHKEAL